LNFKKPGTYIVTVTFGKIKKVVTINVSSPAAKKVVAKVPAARSTKTNSKTRK